jgi:hypothetical protein
MIEQKLEQELEQRLSVLIVATDNEQRALLKALVDSTKVVRSVDACENFPVADYPGGAGLACFGKFRPFESRCDIGGHPGR